MVRELDSDASFDRLMREEAPGDKLAVVDFTATWCNPCKQIAPVFAAFATKYPNAFFLKVDVDKCQATTGRFGVTAMPTFVFLKNLQQIDKISGADPNALEAKIKMHYNPDAGSDPIMKDAPPGMQCINSLINKAEFECLNEDGGNPGINCLTTDSAAVTKSDCDEQLLLRIGFQQPIKLHSIRIDPSQSGGIDEAPKELGLYANVSSSLDFDTIESCPVSQQLVLNKEDVLKEKPVELKFVKFQNVNSLTVFIKSNFGGGDITSLKLLALYGIPVNQTNMNEFKRVAGKAGEAH
ncbi:thioredoxin-like protein 1 [Convolutriloba macropyga]|uniref:thioredoxin-like protein 1 n=1 Tax=Convolutriloba macropyga TaxID=536237 RepID=UPI003F5278C3